MFRVLPLSMRNKFRVPQTTTLNFVDFSLGGLVQSRESSVERVAEFERKKRRGVKIPAWTHRRRHGDREVLHQYLKDGNVFGLVLIEIEKLAERA